NQPGRVEDGDAQTRRDRPGGGQGRSSLSHPAHGRGGTPPVVRRIAQGLLVPGRVSARPGLRPVGWPVGAGAGLAGVRIMARVSEPGGWAVALVDGPPGAPTACKASPWGNAIHARADARAF